MTNTLNTPVEALEAYYPLRIEAYALRSGSGGRGLHRGGDGLVREVRVLDRAEVTLLTDRRRIAPHGLAGGRPGRRGRNWLCRNGRLQRLPGKLNLQLEAGDAIRIETPGGGGWGRKKRRIGVV